MSKPSVVRRYTPEEISGFIFLPTHGVKFVLDGDFYSMEQNFLNALSFQGHLAQELAAAQTVIQELAAHPRHSA